MTRKAKFTNPVIKALKPEDKYYRVWDTDVPGLFLQVYPTERLGFKFSYSYHTRPRIITIGPYPQFTIEQARNMAKGYRGDLARDLDPREMKREKRASVLRENVAILEDFIDKDYGPWLEENRKSGVSTQRDIKAYWKDFLSQRMDAITPEDIERHLRKRKKAGLKPVTIRRRLADLSALYTRAIKWKVVSVNPVATVERPKIVEDRRVRYLDADEEARLRTQLACRDKLGRQKRASANEWRQARGYRELPAIIYKDFLTAFVLLALNTGCRRGELLSLKWSNVNLKLRTLTVSAYTAKSAKTRHIPLNDEAHDLLAEWKKQSGAGLVFTHPDTGKQMFEVRGSWKKVLLDAKITDFRVHDLRHTFASKLVMAGVDLNTVRELLGHASLEMTLRYSHLSPDHKAAAVDLLSRK